MEKYPPSQAEVLDAFIRALNVERRANYVIAGRPDEVERNLAEVDYILRDSARSAEIAAEVSSTWRSDVAGKEDADWLAWAEAVRGLVRGVAPAEFRISTPMTIPRDLKPDDFAQRLVEVLGREHRADRRCVLEPVRSHGLQRCSTRPVSGNPCTTPMGCTSTSRCAPGQKPC